MTFPTMWYVRPAQPRSACANTQSNQSLCLSLEYSMSDKLLTKHNLESLSFKGGCRGSSESTLVKMPHCWISHVSDQITVNSEIFARVLFSRNFAYAKFREIKTLAKKQTHSVVY